MSREEKTSPTRLTEDPLNNPHMTSQEEAIDTTKSTDDGVEFVVEVGEVQAAQSTTAGVCRHWLRGFCLYADRCRAPHPPELQGRDATTRTLRGNGKVRVRNSSKTLVFRRWLLEVFGRVFLASGSGVIDVAGGKGQLSFELVNLNAIQSTVWDPRELDLAHFVERYQLGMYHRNEIWKPFLHTPDPLTLENPRPEQPGHVRMFFDEALIRALSELQQQQQEGGLPSSGEPHSFETLYYRAAGLVSQVRWSKKGLIFDPLTRSLSGVVNKHEYHNSLKGTRSVASATIESLPETILTSSSFSSSSSSSTPTTTIDSSSSSSGDPTSSSASASSSASSSSSSTQVGEVVAEVESGLQPWHEVRDLLLNSSILIGLHPDQAVGAIVDFAIAFKKPFAVLPCCVYSKQYPKRHLPGPPKKQVSGYPDLCQWIQNKDPENIRRVELPMEGKNVLLYYIPPGAEGPLAEIRQRAFGLTPSDG